MPTVCNATSICALHQWHLGQKSPAYLPSHRGFDRYYGYYQGVMDYWTHAGKAAAGDPEHDPEQGRIPSSTNRTKFGGPVMNGGLDLHGGGLDLGTEGQLDRPVWNASGQYSSDLFAKIAGEWIVEHGRTKSTQPMFLYLAFQGCHSGDNAFVQAPPNIMRTKFESISPNATCGSWQHPQSGDCTLVAMVRLH